MKRSMAILLAILMVVSVIPFTALGTFAAVESAESNNGEIFSQADSLKAGDIIPLGSYPQTLITDENIISKLNALGGNWITYSYPDGVGEMLYKDVICNGVKYRAIKITKYRVHAAQKYHGYYENTVYWFKYETLYWKLLDPATGLAVCETVIDSNEYHHTSATTNGYYANNYVKSDIRNWLLNTFIDTAFTSSEKSHIDRKYIDNSAVVSTYSSESTDDLVFLLSKYEVDSYMNDAWNRVQGTDYAKSQGVFYGEAGVQWLLRTAANNPYSFYYVHYRGLFIAYYNWYDDAIWLSGMAVRPAVYLKDAESLLHRGFTPEIDGWSFVNGYEGFDYPDGYKIPAERYETVFGKAYTSAATIGGKTLNSMMPEWGGNCYGMSATAILFYLGKLDLNKYDTTPLTVNSCVNSIRHNWFSDGWISAEKDSNVTNLIECYQILQEGYYGGYKGENDSNPGSTHSLLDSEFWSISTDEKGKTKYEHKADGKYIEKVYNKIVSSKEPLMLSMIGAPGSHAMVIRTDKKPLQQNDGWIRVYVYDPNHPYLADTLLLEGYKLKSYYLNNYNDDTYIELNPTENKWRYRGSTRSGGFATYWGSGSNGKVKTYGKDKKPEYMRVYNLMETDYPTSFNGNEPFLVKVKNIDDYVSACYIAITEKSTIIVRSKDDHKKLLFVEDGVVKEWDESVKYEPNPTYIEPEEYDENEEYEPRGGKLYMPCEDFIIEYESGDDISIIDNDSVISLVCDTAAVVDVKTSQNRVEVLSKDTNNISAQISDVSGSNEYSSVYVDGVLEENDTVTLELDKFNTEISADITGDGSLDVYADCDASEEESYITTLDNNTEEVLTEDIRDYISEISVENYDVTIKNASDIVALRYALGNYQTAKDIKNAPGSVTLSSTVIEANLNEKGDLVYGLPEGGIYSLWYRRSDGTEFIVSELDVTYMTQEVEMSGALFKICNLYGVSDFFVAKGTYDTYRDVKNNYFLGITSERFGAKHNYAYSECFPGAGEYTVCVRYTDTSRPAEFIHFTVEVNEPEVTVADGILTIDNLDGVKSIRVAPGTFAKFGEVKKAVGCTTYSGKALAALLDADGTSAVLTREPGEYTIAVQYQNGYTALRNITVG